MKNLNPTLDHDVEAGGTENTTATKSSSSPSSCCSSSSNNNIHTVPLIVIPWSWRAVRISLELVGVLLAIFVLYHSTINPFRLLPASYSYHGYYGSSSRVADSVLESVLKNASREDGTVILTTLNEAWAKPGSLLDLFLKSFQIGNGTQRLLNHLVIVTLDKNAYARCVALHPHCYELVTSGVNFSTEAFFMTHDYLQMMWRRIDFLTTVLEMGYSFVFTDADIMWLQDPFNHLYPDADFQIACDKFIGNSSDLRNKPNGGFTYVKSNPKTVSFYKFWYQSRLIYPGQHDQDVLNKIKTSPFLPKLGLRVKFLDTAYFGGFCEFGTDFKLISTMHANCCVGLENKVHDLKILLRDWNNYFKKAPSTSTSTSTPSWTVPQDCRTSFQRGRQRKNSYNASNKGL